MLHLINKKRQNVLLQHLFHAIQHNVNIRQMHFLQRASSNVKGKFVRTLIVMAEQI